MTSGDDVDRRAYNIESIEKRGDKIAHIAIELLHRTFITPLDRDDIHQLVSKMDDILDVIEDNSQSIYVYDVHSITPEAECSRVVGCRMVCAAFTVPPRPTVGICPRWQRGEPNSTFRFR